MFADRGRGSGRITRWATRSPGVGGIAGVLLLVCLVTVAPAGELDEVKRDLWAGLPPDLLRRPTVDPPLTFRGPTSLAAAIYKERVGSVVALAVRDTIGAGSLVSALGDIVTNEHLLRTAHRARGDEWVLAWFKPAGHSPATREDFLLARVLSRDARRDLALIRLVERAPAAAAIPLAPEPPEIGADVFAIGHPKNYLWSLTQGVVSQIRAQYTWVGADGVSRSATAIQTRVPAGPGSSGGPLLDRRGAMVGVVFASVPFEQGMYLAIEAQHVRQILERKGLGR